LISTVHKAKWVMLDPWHWIENGSVEILSPAGRGSLNSAEPGSEDYLAPDSLPARNHLRTGGPFQNNCGRISAFGKAKNGASTFDHGAGVILPALVNAHTHVSLAGLSGLAESNLDFTNWVKELIRLRTEISPDEMNDASIAAAHSMKSSGTGYLAEVGTIDLALRTMKDADIDGTIFVEVLGNYGDLPNLPKNESDVCFSYAAHALHTTAPQVMRSLKAATVARKSVFSIHLAESQAESEFLSTGDGAWADLLKSRGIDYSDWDLINETPVKRAERLGLLGPDTLAVHVLQIDKNDLAVLARTLTRICLCPRSNAILHKNLPDVPAFLDAGITPGLGTDSLASNSSLSLFDEMAFLAKAFPEIRPETILGMATCFGSDALGRPDLGRIQIGNKARLIYVNLDADSAEHAASQLVVNKPGQVDWL
jgi:aminodeoxyfutalosine deaminase